MKILFVISLLLFAIPFSVKSILHVILDNRNRYQVDYGSSRGYVYFLPYSKEVSAKDENLKRLCNYLHKASLFFLVVFVIVFVIKIIGQK